MKYFSISSVEKAYEAVSSYTKDKFWGIFGILYSIESIAKPGVNFSIDTCKLSTFLEQTFRLKDKKSYDATHSVYSVVFANDWETKTVANFTIATPDIIPVIVWAYRNVAFSHEYTAKELLEKFIIDFHISKDSVEKFFRVNLDEFQIEYKDTIYNDEDLLKELGGSVSSDAVTLKMNKSFVVANAGDLSRGPFFQPLYAALNTLECLIIFPFDAKEYYQVFTTSEKKLIDGTNAKCNQIIYYGTPGSGKSHKVKGIVESVDVDFVFRTTFHPDSDYASFVGCYKPVMEKLNERLYTEKELLDILKDFKVKGTNYPCQKFAFKYWNSLEILGSTIQKKILSSCDYNPDTYNAEISKGIALGKEFYNNKRSEIKYQFTPQTFTKAYVAAWNNPEQQIYLIIEEINRGNCAQIFGDLFQLLDRENGVSEYPIDADNDLKDYLEQELGAGHEGIKNGKLKLPSNLNILATMNTSDQSLFPMDSAFKRRWAWECVPVDYTNSVSGKFTIEIGGSKYKWHDFLLKANNKIKDLTFSEDKQMGNFFISSNVDKRQFIDKVMFYLWNDICKDEYGSGSFFRRYIDDNNPESEFSFNDLFGEENKIETILNGFMEYLAVEKIEAATSTGEEQ